MKLSKKVVQRRVFVQVGGLEENRADETDWIGSLKEDKRDRSVRK